MVSVTSQRVLLNKVFNHKSLLFLCFVIALVSKVLLMHYYFDFNTDKMLQALSAKSLVEGKGVTLPMVKNCDLSSVFYRPLIAWPPGYAYVLAPFYFLTKDVKWSAFLIDGLSAGLFMLIYFYVLKKMQFGNGIISFLLLFNGLFISQEIVYSAPTDLLSASLVLLSVYYCILPNQRKNVSLLRAICAGVLCFLPAFFRYLYIPLAPVIPAIVLFEGVQAKKKNQRTLGGIALFVALLFVFVQMYGLLTTKGFSGNNYTPDTRMSLNFPALKNIHPFIFSSFVNLDFAAQQLSLVTGRSYAALIKSFRIVHYGILLVAVVVGSRTIIRLLQHRATIWDDFFLVSLMVSSVIVLVLCVFSLFTPPEAVWTYVQEERYYKFVAVCLPIYFFRFLNLDFLHRRLRLKNVVACIIFFLLCLEIIHGFYFIQKNVLPVHNLRTVNYALDEPYFSSLIQKAKAEGKEVVVASTSQFYYGHATLYKANALYKCEDVNGPLFTKKPVCLLVILEQDQLPQYKSFLSKQGVRLESIHKNIYFYSLLVDESLNK